MSTTATTPNRFAPLPDEHALQTTVTALEKHGFGVEIVGDLDAAREAVLARVPEGSCRRIWPALNASRPSDRQNALSSQPAGRGFTSRPAPRKYQVKGLIAGNGRRAFHHLVPAHTPGS